MNIYPTPEELAAAMSAPGIVRTYTVPAELHALVKGKAAVNGDTVSAIIRRALAAYMRDEDML